MSKKKKNLPVQKVWVVQHYRGSDPDVHGVYKTSEDALAAVRAEVSAWELPEEEAEEPSFYCGELTWHVSDGTHWAMYCITEHEIE